MPEKVIKRTCECKNCGNEAEMMITCTLEDSSDPATKPTVVPEGQGKIKGHAVCSNCGGDADIWLDY